MREFIRIVEGLTAAADPASVNDASEAQRRLHPTVRTPEFRRWFSGSKVVNSDGSPRVVYHGTLESFDTFQLVSKTRVARGINRLGFWFDEGTDTPSYFANANPHNATGRTGTVMPVFLSIRKPFTLVSEATHHEEEASLEPHIRKGDWAAFNAAYEAFDRTDAWHRLRDLIAHSPNDNYRAYEDRVDEVRAEIIGEGYDGIYLTDTYADAGSRGGKRTNWWVAFHPTQIKSAISNSGSYSSESPSIHEGRK